MDVSPVKIEPTINIYPKSHLNNGIANKITINLSKKSKKKTFTSNTISYITFNIKYSLELYFSAYVGIITNEYSEDFLRS